MTIQESTVLAPVFVGDDTEIAAATGMWASIVSIFSYGQADHISAENKKAFFAAMAVYASDKIREIDNVTTPPPVAASSPSFVPAPEMPATAPQNQEVDFTYAEQKKPENPGLKRMRELAGLAHVSNHV